MPGTRSEQLVADLCRGSFLSLWSEPNPLVRLGKELCDVLVVCDPYVILFSVKEIVLGDSGDIQTDWGRWHKRAINGSVKQLYGGARALNRMTRVLRHDGSVGLALPAVGKRDVFLVAVALGGRGSVPIEQGEFGKGYVHVLDEIGIRHLMTELDTISDFVGYLKAKECIGGPGPYPVVEGHEEDLLAVYLHGGRRFPSGPDIIVIGAGSWDELTRKPEWLRRKDADKESRVWDGLIETLRELNEPSFTRSVSGDTSSEPADALDQHERVLRTMAREDRFARRILASCFNEFMAQAAHSETRSCVVKSPSGVVYVFLATGRKESRQARIEELSLRSFVARGLNPDSTTVVGIATERYVRGSGFSMDVVHLTKLSWSSQDEHQLARIQDELGYFKAPRLTPHSADEYPTDS